MEWRPTTLVLAACKGQLANVHNAPVAPYHKVSFMVVVFPSRGKSENTQNPKMHAADRYKLELLVETMLEVCQFSAECAKCLPSFAPTCISNNTLPHEIAFDVNTSIPCAFQFHRLVSCLSCRCSWRPLNESRPLWRSSIHSLLAVAHVPLLLAPNWIPYYSWTAATGVCCKMRHQFNFPITLHLDHPRNGLSVAP